MLSVMLNVVFALAARGTLTKKLVEPWTASAAKVGMSPIVECWLIFASGLFVDNVIVREVAVRDRSRAWPYHHRRVATGDATRPAELVTIHGYWADVLP